MPTVTFKFNEEYPIGRNITQYLQAKVRSVMRGTAEHAVEQIKTIILQKDVYLTGDLYRSIGLKQLSPGNYEISAGMHYWVYQEYGTKHIKARPFMRPGIRRAKVYMDKNLKKVFDEVNRTSLTNIRSQVAETRQVRSGISTQRQGIIDTHTPDRPVRKQAARSVPLL